MRLHLVHVLVKSFLHQFLLLHFFCSFFAISSSSFPIAIFLVILWSTRKLLSLLMVKASSCEIFKSFDSYVIIKQCPLSFCWPVFCSGFSLFFPYLVLWRTRLNCFEWEGGMILQSQWIVSHILRGC